MDYGEVAEKLGRIDSNVEHLLKDVDQLTERMSNLKCSTHSAKIDELSRWQTVQKGAVQTIFLSLLKTVVSGIAGGAIVFYTWVF